MMRRRVGYTGMIFGSDFWAAAWRGEKSTKEKARINERSRVVRRGRLYGRKRGRERGRGEGGRGREREREI